MPKDGAWNPPDFVSRNEIVRVSEAVLGRPDFPFKTSEDIYRIHTADMDWDMAAVIY